MNLQPPVISRREVLRDGALGFGWLAFSGLATNLAAATPIAHFPPRARRVIFLCMRGAPSQFDTITYKPKLNVDSGRDGPRPGTKLLGSAWRFKQHGESGMWISELLPHLARQTDRICMVHSMTTDVPAHAHAFVKLHTGVAQSARPSLGAWTLHGLGSVNQNLPGFITITPPAGFGGAQNYGSAFLPAIHQGTPIGADKLPIANAVVPNLTPKLDPVRQRAEIDLSQIFNRGKLAREGPDQQVEGVIESFELAFKMQNEMPSVMSLSEETDATKKLYGIDEPATDDCGRKCLLARRMIEAGVRFVEVTHGDWDTHLDMRRRLPDLCASVDKPVAGLLADLEARGLLKDTLVIWGGEFGRTPHVEGSDGRDHHVTSFSLWMAGGGVKAGFSYGETDDHGYEVTQGKMTIHDWHATILHLLGLDHEALTYHYAGRDFRLTDRFGSVVKELIS